jgi:hypothetical protein
MCGEPDSLLYAVGRDFIAVAAMLIVMADLIKNRGVAAVGGIREIEVGRHI